MATAEIIELESGKSFATATTDANGEFLFTLPAGGNYALNVSKEKYLFYSENFALTEPGTLDQPYKLETCIVSGEKLGEMGEPFVFVHEGQEIKLCCKSCMKKFDKDPAKFLKKLTESK